MDIIKTTIEERAKEKALEYVPLDIVHYNIYDIYFDAYTEGAKDQKQIDIDKACEWLQNYFTIEHQGMSASGYMLFEHLFKKAME